MNFDKAKQRADLLREKHNLQGEIESLDQTNVHNLLQGKAYRMKRKQELNLQLQAVETALTFLENEPESILDKTSIDSEAAPNKNKTLEPLKWLGTDRQWGDTIVQLYDKGLIQAESQMDALVRASKVFVNRREIDFKPRSVWQSRKNREDVEGK